MENMQTFDAVVLGGGDGTMLDPAQPVKGLVEIAGKPMIQWVIDALRKANSINRIVAVVPTSAIDQVKASDITVVAGDGTLPENCEQGFLALDGKRPILWATADIPALTPEAVDDYLGRVVQRRAELSYSLIQERDVETQFPGSIRTYIKLREGRATGGNLITTTVAVAHKIEPLMSDFYNARKDPKKVVSLVGPQIATKYALGWLSVPDVEARVKSMLDIRGAGIFTTYAEIGVDVDKVADMKPVENVLRQRMDPSS